MGNRLAALGSRLLSIKGQGDYKALGPLYAAALRIAWPAALEGILISVISSVDTVMVGSLGHEALAAVGLTAQPRMILLLFAQSLHIGTTALIARRKGARDMKAVRSCLDQSMALSLLLGLLITLAGFFLGEPIMALAGAQADTLPMATDYFRIMALGFVPNYLQLCVCAAFRGLGHTKVTMVTHLLSNGLNMVFNFLLIGGRLGFPALGVRGAALATVIGNLAAFALALWFAMRQASPFAYRLRWPAFDQLTLKGLSQIGSASALEAGSLRLGFMIQNIIIASLGTAVFAAYHIISQVSSLSFTLGDGIAAAGVSLVGQSLGAKQQQRAIQVVAVTRRISLFASVFLMVLIFLLRRDLAALFTREEGVIAMATAGLLVMIPAILPQNARVVYSGCLRGAGDVRYVALVAFISVALLRPLITWLFCFPLASALPALQLSATGPWLAYLLDALIRTRLLRQRVDSGIWTRMQLR